MMATPHWPVLETFRAILATCRNLSAENDLPIECVRIGEFQLEELTAGWQWVPDPESSQRNTALGVPFEVVYGGFDDISISYSQQPMSDALHDTLEAVLQRYRQGEI